LYQIENYFKNVTESYRRVYPPLIGYIYSCTQTDNTNKHVHACTQTRYYKNYWMSHM